MGHKVQFCLIFLPRSKYLFDDSSDRADARSLFWLLWPALGRGRLGNFEMNKILKNIALKSRIYNAKCKLKLLWRETSRTTLSKEKWDKKHVLAQKLIFTTTTHQNYQSFHSPQKNSTPTLKRHRPWQRVGIAPHFPISCKGLVGTVHRSPALQRLSLFLRTIIVMLSCLTTMILN